ncbi:MAG: hypothetical protein VW686_02510 [Luminiphilus sp.]|jgi:hypothetical protein
MTITAFKRYARWVLCAAILFVAGNTVHALEHTISSDVSQNHAECSHCSGEHSAAVANETVAAFDSSVPLQNELVVSACVAVPTSNFQARAPPLS